MDVVVQPFTYYLALYAQVREITNGYSPAHDVILWALKKGGFDPNAEVADSDIVPIIKIAIEVVQGLVTSMEKEGDLSVSINWDAVRANIFRISKKYGLNPAEYITLSTIEDISYMW